MTRPVVFFSHASANDDVAKPLAADMRAEGIDVWYDEWEIKPGDSIRRKIDEGIDKATHFLVLLTPESLRSEWVQTEMDGALVNRILGKCRLVPILSGISLEQVPATLRGLLYIKWESGADCLRKLIEVCYEVSSKPPLGPPPAWATSRPLEGSPLTPTAQRIVAWIAEQSKDGASHELFERDAIINALSLAPEQAGMAADELRERQCVKLLRDSGSGRASFSEMQPTVSLFRLADPVIKGWDTIRDAKVLAATMVNLAQADDVANLIECAQHLGWEPRRVNPAAEYLNAYGIVKAFETCGTAPYSYSDAHVTYKTRRFAEAESVA